MTQPQDYTNAAKLDILDMLSREALGIFEFRRIADIASMMCPLVDSLGQAVEHEQLGRTMHVSESKAPHLHSVLSGRTFDGQALLRAKYSELQQSHRELKLAHLGVQDAAAQVEHERRGIENDKNLLKAHAESLERERERVGLLAASAGVTINLPRLPALPSLGGGTEETEEQPDL
jgi:hypothetical protein